MMFSNNENYNDPFAYRAVTMVDMSSCYKYAMLLKADQLDSLKKFCILSENVIFHE